MSTRQCAVPPIEDDPDRPFSHLARQGRRVLASLLLLLAGLLPAAPLHAQPPQTIIVSISLNQVPKGDYFVLLADDGSLLVRATDLDELGLEVQLGEPFLFEGEEYVDVEALTGVTTRFHEDRLLLEIAADPSLLPSSEIDLRPERRTDVFYPRDNSLFLNYGLNYSAGGEGLDYQGVSLANELGIRYRDLLFLTDSQFNDTSEGQELTRLMSSATFDRRDRMQRLVIGDFFASSGELGNRLNLGGVSFSKIYRIDPYFVRYPLFDFTGLLSQPAEVELLVNGQRVSSERFAPGEFTLRNFQGFGGAQTMEVVIRDALGRERRIITPFYFTDQILRRGLHEYSYNLGLVREDFGQQSNAYGEAAFTGFHRYGVSDRLNLGLLGEASAEVAGLGAELAWKFRRIGLVRLQGVGSRAGDEVGWAGLLSYQYQSRNVRSRLAVQGFSDAFRRVGDSELAARQQYNLLAGVGYATARSGSLALDYARSANYGEPERETLTLSWSKHLLRRIYANLRVSRIKDPEEDLLAELTLNWHLGADTSVSATLRRDREGTSQVLDGRRNIPIGRGYGWEVRGERSAADDGESYLLDSMLQYNASHAILRGDFSLGRSETISTEDLRLSLSGALVAVGDSVSLTRPVRDSFALISVGDVEGVDVLVNGQLSGETDGKGRLVLPELSSYYENQVAIEPDNIPLDYLMPRVRLFLSPPLRSGSCINFPLRRYQAFTGSFEIPGESGPRPLANAEITLETPAGPLDFWTGMEGEFYFDSQQAEFDFYGNQGCDALSVASADFLPPGAYPLVVRREGEAFRSTLEVPAVDDQVTDLGRVLLETGQPAGPPQEPRTNAGASGQPTPPQTLAGGPDLLEPADEPAPVVPVESGLTPPAGPAVPAAIVAGATDSPPAAQSEARIEERTIYFAFDRYWPELEQRKVLVDAIAYLLNHPEVQVAIEGHASRQGANVYNLRLGLRRAQATKSYLLRAGIEPERIIAVRSYGEFRPVCPEPDPCGDQDQRVVLRLVKG